MIVLKLPALATCASSESRTTLHWFAPRGCACTICPLLWCIWVRICWLVHPCVWCFASRFCVLPLLMQQEKATPIQHHGTLSLRLEAWLDVRARRGSRVPSFALCWWRSILSLCGWHCGSTSWWPCRRGQREGRSWRRPLAWVVLSL